MRVTMIGSGDAFGSGGRFQTCIALAPDDPARPPHTLVDCGATSLTALRQQRVDPNQIATVVLTHLHGDHFGGLPFLILDGQFRRRDRDLTVLGPPGTGERLRQAMETLYPGSSTVRRRFEVHVREHREREPASVDGRTVVPYEVRHAAGAPAYAVRVDIGDGTTMAYSGDTEWTDALVDVAAGADLFIAESYFWDKAVPYHLRHADLLAHRDVLTSDRVVLTHMSADMLAHADEAAFPLAHDGLTIDL